jgi:hypothetical protein
MIKVSVMDPGAPDSCATSHGKGSLRRGNHPLCWAVGLALAGPTIGTGCGGGNDSGSDGEVSGRSESFLGTWSCSGTQTETCGTASHSDPVNFALTVTKGATATAIASTLGPFAWTVSGSTAKLEKTTLATEPGSVGGTWTPTYTSGSLALSDGELQWTAAGKAIYVNGATQTCDFKQIYTCTPSADGTEHDGGAPGDDAGPKLDSKLAGTWSYMGNFFYPDPGPPQTPGVDISNPPLSLLISADGTYEASMSGVPLAPKGTWSVGTTTSADWKQWRQQYNFQEKLILVGADGITWDGYVDDGDPSGETMGPPQCLDLFYTQAQPAGYYWLRYCHSVGTRK